MDEGPFRTPRPVERRPASRTEPAHQPEPPREAANTAAARQSTASRHVSKEEKPAKRLAMPIIIAVIIILLAVGGWLVWSRMQNGAPAIDSSKYQAVFFTNGQVYFGKLQAANSQYMKLTDIFYLQTQAKDTDSENPQATSSDQNDVQLIKLGDEIHGPEDEMVIARDQMLFYENLKPDGKVAQKIAEYNSKQ